MILNPPDELTRLLLDWSAIFIRKSMQDFNQYTHSQGFSMVHMTVLMHLHYRGACEVTHFCEPMQISPAGASQMIERMAQRGLVVRLPHPTDRRSRLVDLTDYGRQVVTDSIAARETWLSQIVTSLSAEDRQRITSALKVLNEHAEGL